MNGKWHFSQKMFNPNRRPWPYEWKVFMEASILGIVFGVVITNSIFFLFDSIDLSESRDFRGTFLFDFLVISFITFVFREFFVKISRNYFPLI